MAIHLMLNEQMSPMDEHLGTPVRGSGTLGVLTREVRVRIVNCSLSGVLFESNAPVPVGTVAALTLRIGHHEFHDDVRVVRCQSIAGAGSLHHVAAELLWTGMPGQKSLRLALQQRVSTADTF